MKDEADIAQRKAERDRKQAELQAEKRAGEASSSKSSSCGRYIRQLVQYDLLWETMLLRRLR